MKVVVANIGIAILIGSAILSGATNNEGNLYMTVIGDYTTFDNQIVRDASIDYTTGTARFY